MYIHIYLKILLMHMCICLLIDMSILHMCLCRPEEGMEIPGAGIVGGCEPSNVGTGN